MTITKSDIDVKLRPMPDRRKTPRGSPECLHCLNILEGRETAPCPVHATTVTRG